MNVLRLSIPTIFLLSFAGVSSAETAAAESWRKNQPPPGPRATPILPRFEKAVLDNGLTVLVGQSGPLPIVTFRMVTRGGAARDPAGKGGLTALSYAMLQEGAGDNDALAFSDAVADLGASFAAGADRDHGTVAITGLTWHAPAMMSLLRDAILRPRLEATDFDRVRQQTVAALVRQRSSPQGLAFEALPALIYGGEHPFGHPPTGTVESVQDLTIDEVKAHVASLFGPKRSALVVAGPVSLEDATSLAQRFFGSWRNEGAGGEDSIPFVESSQRTTLWLRNKDNSPQTMLLIGRPVVPKGHPDEPALTLANDVFGGNFSSRLNMNLREDKGYTYGAHSNVAFRAGVGAFVAYSAVRKDVAGASLVEFFAELEKMKSAPPTAEEIERVKSGISRSLPGSFERTGAVSSAAAAIFLYDLGLDYFTTLGPRLENVRPEEIRAAIERYLNPGAMKVLLVGEEASMGPQVEGLGLGKPETLP